MKYLLPSTYPKCIDKPLVEDPLLLVAEYFYFQYPCKFPIGQLFVKFRTYKLKI